MAGIPTTVILYDEDTGFVSGFSFEASGSTKNSTHVCLHGTDGSGTLCADLTSKLCQEQVEQTDRHLRSYSKPKKPTVEFGFTIKIKF